MPTGCVRLLTHLEVQFNSDTDLSWGTDLNCLPFPVAVSIWLAFEFLQLTQLKPLGVVFG